MYREHPLFSNPQVSFNNPKYSPCFKRGENRKEISPLWDLSILCFRGKTWNVILYFDCVPFLFFPFV